MSYKTILAHFNGMRRLERLLPVAMSLAERFQAHLIGLSVLPPVAVITTGMPAGVPIVLDEHCKLYRQENAAMKSKFELAVRGRPFVAEWRDDGADAFGVAARVLQHASTVDLVIANQTDPNWPGSEELDVADRLALGSGRPVLIVPNTGMPRDIGQNVLVAWNARREATRAIFDALPILQRAKDVQVVWVNPQSEYELAQDFAAADICATLAREGVNCRATEQIKPRASVGETLLSCAKEFDTDLLVMGCYGHTRFRELVFGGASRHVLAHMTVPVLMSH
jgi:nucleotide-binding universal stress UspA family protein